MQLIPLCPFWQSLQSHSFQISADPDHKSKMSVQPWCCTRCWQQVILWPALHSNIFAHVGLRPGFLALISDTLTWTACAIMFMTGEASMSMLLEQEMSGGSILSVIKEAAVLSVMVTNKQFNSFHSSIGLFNSLELIHNVWLLSSLILDQVLWKWMRLWLELSCEH